ncbi:Ig-like domain-containing protein [Corallococcus sp. bb12-1]|uniref:Ig-like domain-containing protein n=1 Tax=Corallococcus sp. bb12-1 TaxID=2996784 RepID=UPI00226FD5D7|nr:Ig-like domain-containing protein [Corallococcus sp. bb12-1]MCY1040528.1 Ig-like domain-containing protein [Corallococcus sp. bb12-1]
MPVVHGALRLGLCLLTFVLACGSTEPDPRPGEDDDNDKVAALTLSPNGATLLVGEALTLAVLAVDDTGRVLNNAKVTWSSSPPGPVTVARGRMEGVAPGVSVITAKAGLASATLSVRVLPADPFRPSSDEVLMSAREVGLINDEELLAYRVYATFNDPRLPSQYKARVEPGVHASALEALHARFDSLSAPTQNALGMYLLRPADPGSWLNAPFPDARLRGMGRPSCSSTPTGWNYQSASSAKVRVWYQGTAKVEREKAMMLFAAIENEIWPRLTRLGLKAPLTDEAYDGCNGGSPQLDVYLVRNMTQGGLTVSEDRFNPKQAATHILLSAELDEPSLKGSAAHELMHAIQWSYASKGSQLEQGWIREAIATWAIDYVYNTLLVGKTDVTPYQLEHEFAACFMKTPFLALESREKCQGGVGRDYGAYLFFQFLSKKYGPIFVATTLTNLTTEASSLTALDSAVPDNLWQVWPLFAKALWNQAPIDTQAESFNQWDALTQKVQSMSGSADLNGLPEKQDDFPDELSNLSNRYVQFTFSDPDTRSVLFHNGWFKNVTASGEPIKVLAFWSDANGTWHEEDWSRYEYIGFCRDLKSQRVQELVIIFSNAKFEPGGGGTLKAAATPYLKRNNVGCWKYQGSSKSVLKAASWSGPGTTLDANLEFKVMGGFATADFAHPSLPYTKRLGAFMLMPYQGDFTIDIDYVSGECRYTHGPASYAGIPEGGAMQLNPFNELKSPDPTIQAWLSRPARAYTTAITDGRLVNLTVSGGEECRRPAMDEFGSILVTDTGSPPLVKANGEMSGTLVTGDTSYSWTLKPQREP